MDVINFNNNKKKNAESKLSLHRTDKDFFLKIHKCVIG